MYVYLCISTCVFFIQLLKKPKIWRELLEMVSIVDGNDQKEKNNNNDSLKYQYDWGKNL